MLETMAPENVIVIKYEDLNNKLSQSATLSRLLSFLKTQRAVSRTMSPTISSEAAVLSKETDLIRCALTLSDTPRTHRQKGRTSTYNLTTSQTEFVFQLFNTYLSEYNQRFGYKVSLDSIFWQGTEKHLNIFNAQKELGGHCNLQKYIVFLLLRNAHTHTYTQLVPRFTLIVH